MVQQVSLPILHLHQSPPQNDFTIYLDASSDGQIEEILSGLQPKKNAESTYSVDCSVQLECEDGLSNKVARIIACRCFGGKKWSVTIRGGGNVGPSVDRATLGSNFKAPSDYPDEFLCSLSILCEALYHQIFLEQGKRTGLIVVTGATASGKSEITRGLIELRMQEAARAHQENPKTIRRPHLITFEDPIEKFYVSDNHLAQPPKFDYTPREKDVDALSVKLVFRDALRQTPTLVFVGEIRDPREWSDVLDFASTGHSVIATAHAGSLAESWGKILTAAKVSTAAGRSDVADRILGIVHLRSFAEAGLRCVLPALWRYTASGAMALMADGRSSLLPLRDVPPKEESSFGRVWFKNEIVKYMKNELKDLQELPPPLAKSQETKIAILPVKIEALEKEQEFDRATLRSDLEGL